MDTYDEMCAILLTRIEPQELVELLDQIGRAHV